MRRRLRAGGWIACGLLAAACGDGPTVVREVATVPHSVDVAGASRAYRVYVPEGAVGDRPLLLVFHGATQTSVGAELMTWLYPVADEAGYIVAYPQATGDYWNTPNSPVGFWNVPDVPFVDRVIDDVDARYGVDRSRIYATGFSNGAIFTEVLACTRGDRLAAVAIVGAGLSTQVADTCPWIRPVPALFFLGDADPQFFWDNGLASNTGMYGGTGSADWWASNNGCDDEPTTHDLPDSAADDTTVERWEYEGCAAEFVFYRIRGGGHTWPGSPINLGAALGRKTRDLSASRLMVEFFDRHTLPGGTP